MGCSLDIVKKLNFKFYLCHNQNANKKQMNLNKMRQNKVPNTWNSSSVEEKP
jgi:hypothetical protein